MKPAIFIIIFVLIHAFAFADKIYLKDGKEVEGKIIEETEDYVKIELNINLTYFADQIERIERDATISPQTKAYLESLKNIKVNQKQMQQKETLPLKKESEYGTKEAVEGMGLDQLGQVDPDVMAKAREITDALIKGDDEKIAQMGIDPQMLKQQLESGPSGNAYKEIMRKLQGQNEETER